MSEDTSIKTNPLEVNEQENDATNNDNYDEEKDNSKTINNFDELNEEWKKGKRPQKDGKKIVENTLKMQLFSMNNKGKKKYEEIQKTSPKPPKQPPSMLPRQSLSVHRFLQYCNSDKEGNEKKSIFLWHNVGSGKTFTSLIIALNSLDLFNTNPTKNVFQTAPNPSTKKKIIIVAPGGIFVNFENELKEKLNVTLSKELTQDEKKDSILENTEGYNDCNWYVDGKKSKTFKLIGYRYSSIVKFIKNNTDTYVNPLKKLFADSVVIFDEAHRLFRPIEPGIQTAEYFIDNGLLQHSLRCILMTGTPFNTLTTDIITMLTFMKCAVLIPPVDKKCSRIYPIEFISKTPRPTDIKEIVCTSAFGVFCSIMNFFPGGSFLLSISNWPLKIKRYMSILNEDWEKRGITIEEGILELLGRAPSNNFQLTGLIENINNDKELNKDFTFIDIESFFKDVGFTGEIDKNLKKTINELFQGTPSLIKIDDVEIKKYNGKYESICNYIDFIENEVTSINLSNDDSFIRTAKLYVYIKKMCLLVGVDLFLFNLFENYFKNILQSASNSTTDFVINNIGEVLLYIFTHDIFQKNLNLTEQQKEEIVIKVSSFSYNIFIDLYNKIVVEIKKYCNSIKVNKKVPIKEPEPAETQQQELSETQQQEPSETQQQEPSEIEINNIILDIFNNFTKETVINIQKLQKEINEEIVSISGNIVSRVENIYYGVNYLNEGIESCGVIIKNLKINLSSKEINKTVVKNIELSDFLKAGRILLVGGAVFTGITIASTAISYLLPLANVVLKTGLVAVIVESQIILLSDIEIENINEDDLDLLQTNQTRKCIETEKILSDIENNNEKTLKDIEEQEGEEIEKKRKEAIQEKKSNLKIRLNLLYANLKTIESNLTLIFKSGIFGFIKRKILDINSVKNETIILLESIISNKDKNNETINFFNLKNITGRNNVNITGLCIRFKKELETNDVNKKHDENINFLKTAIANIDEFLTKNKSLEQQELYEEEEEFTIFAGGTRNLPSDIPELIKECYETLKIDEYTDDINLINKQYKKLAIQYHPDKCKKLEGESEIDKIKRCNNIFTEISNAYKNLSEYLDVKNNKYYNILKNLAIVNYSYDNFKNMEKIGIKMENNSNDSKNILDKEFENDDDLINFFKNMIKIVTSDEYIDFYKNNKEQLEEIAYSTISSSEWVSSTKGIIDIYKSIFMTEETDKNALTDNIIKSFTSKDNIYLLCSLVEQVKKFYPIPKLLNPGEEIIIKTLTNSKLITNSEEIMKGGGLFNDNGLWRFIRSQKTVEGTMNIINSIYDNDSISNDTKYHSSYLVFMKSFSDYLDWNGKTSNPVALNLFYKYITFLKTKGLNKKAVELQNFENSIVEDINNNFFSLRSLYHFMLGGNGFGDSIKNMYEKTLYKNTNIDYKKLGDALKSSFSFIDVKMPQIIIGDHSKNTNYEREEDMTANKILEPENHTIISERKKYNYPNSHTELLFVEYTFEQQLFFGEINCDPNPEKWWVKKILQSEKGTPRNTMHRCIGNYSKDCDKFKAVFNGLKEVDLTNSENGNVYFYPEWKLAYAVNNHILNDEEIQKARQDREKEYEIGGKGLFEFKLDDMIKKSDEEQIQDIDEITEVVTQQTNDSTNIIISDNSTLSGGTTIIFGNNIETYQNIIDKYNIINIKGDGNCLYRALQYGLKKTDKGWEKLKMSIIAEERRILKGLNVQTIHEIANLTKEHIDDISRDNVYGTDIEINAFLNMYQNFKVVVHTLNQIPRIICNDERRSCEKEDTGKKEIHLFYDNYITKSSPIDQNHYDILEIKKTIPETILNTVSDGKEVVSKEVSKGKEVVSETVSKGKEVVSKAVSKGEEAISKAVSKGEEVVSKIEESFTKKDSNETNESNIEKIENIRYTYSKYFFDCPKFRQILIQLIIMKTGYMYVSNKNKDGEEKIGLIEQPHLTTTEKYMSEIKNKYNVNMPFGEGDYDLRNYQKLAHNSITESDYYYLPIVWSCSVEMGLNNFGFWLSELGFKYITLHPDHPGYKNELKRGLNRVYPLMKKEDTETIKQKFLNEFFASQSSIDTDALIEYFKSIPNITKYPICVLLHPELVEGVDCVYNPSLLAMEPANTYGDYEQLCGRVLRTYPDGGFEPDKTNPNKNPINKVIYQYSAYNSSNLKNIMEKRFFFGEEPEYFKRTGYDIFYKENKDILNNIFIAVQQEKSKNKFFMENVVNKNDEKNFSNFTELLEYYNKNGFVPDNYSQAVGLIYDIFESLKNATQKVSEIKNDIVYILEKSQVEISKHIEEIPVKINAFIDNLNSLYTLTSSLSDLFSIKPVLEKLIKPIYTKLLKISNDFIEKVKELHNKEILESFLDDYSKNFDLIKNSIFVNILNAVVEKMEIPNIKQIITRFASTTLNIDENFFSNLSSGEELIDKFDLWTNYLKDTANQFASSGVWPDLSPEMSKTIEKFNDDLVNDDDLIKTFTSILPSETPNTNISNQAGGQKEKLKVIIEKSKNTLIFFKPIFNYLQIFVSKTVILLKNPIQYLTGYINLPTETQEKIIELYNKFISENTSISSVINYFIEIKKSIEILYNLDYTNNGAYSSILDAVKSEENVEKLINLIKEKSSDLANKLIIVRDKIVPVFKYVYNNTIFQNVILRLGKAYVKINNNPKIKNLRDKESAFTNSTILNLTSKYLYNYTIDKIGFNIDTIPKYERANLLKIFGENGINLYDVFVKDLQNKIPPYFIRFVLNDWSGNYDNYLAQYKSELSKKLFKRKQLEFKLIKYENSETVKLNREQFGEEKRIRDIFDKASPTFKIKNINGDIIKSQIDKNMAQLMSLSIENESPDLNKLMELRFVQQDIEIVKNYIIKGDGEKEDLIGFTDLSEIQKCIDSIEGDGKAAALNTKWCDPLYPNNDTLCANKSINKPINFVDRVVKNETGGKKTIRRKLIKKEKTKNRVIKIHNKTIKKPKNNIIKIVNNKIINNNKSLKNLNKL